MDHNLCYSNIMEFAESNKKFDLIQRSVLYTGEFKKYSFQLLKNVMSHHMKGFIEPK